MQRILRNRAPRKFADYLNSRAFLRPLEARTRDEAIAALAGAAANVTGVARAEIEKAVLEREEMMSTGIGDGLAVPHARLAGMSSILVAVGVSDEGVDFNARDGEPARLVFMILTPLEDDGAQLEVLADIARLMRDPATRARAVEVQTFTQFLALMRTQRPLPPPTKINR
jgi:mannitol/fructose-specific phosphotransferase system IIA component (Ntr-type)